MKVIIKKIGIFSFILLFLFKSLSYCNDFEKIKILISASPEILLTFNGKFKIYNEFTREEIVTIMGTKPLLFSIKDRKIKIGDYNLFYSAIYIENLSDGNIKFNSHKYNGNFYLVFNTNSIFLINEITIEEYLKGVLPNEISPSWNIEAIKAQAVAARTFAYFYRLKNTGQLYHLKADVLSQVYTGKTGENSNFNRGIKETEDEVLVYKERLIAAYFHSVCGGHTENAEKVWGKSLPYLRGVPCSYCREAPYYKWEVSFTDEELIKKLTKSGYRFTRISAILPEKISSSGRWVLVKIIGRPKPIVINGNRFRLILGAEKLRSTKFRIRRYRGKWVIKGRGWGHGVGLCQWGAKKMAEIGYKYYQILRYYFRGTRLVKISPKYFTLFTNER